jgi:hypothetical protein
MMPMSNPWWFDELPEYMTEAEYRALSEEVSRTIEIVHGHVIKCESPTPKEDLLDKKAQYAAAGIPLNLVVVLDEAYDIAEIREFHLDAATGAYRLYGVHQSVLDLEAPVRLRLPTSNLVTP